MRRRFPALLVLLAAACAPRVEPVTVEFESLRLEGFERGVVELKVTNPNRVAVDLEGLPARCAQAGLPARCAQAGLPARCAQAGLRYSAALGRDTVARGERAEPVRVPARDTARAEFPLELRLELDGIFSRLDALLDDTLRLAVDGRYTVRGLFGPARRPFRYRHDIPLRPEVDRLVGRFKAIFGGE
ncbi:MAG: LEA type 2 family protein [bacterium]